MSRALARVLPFPAPSGKYVRPPRAMRRVVERIPARYLLYGRYPKVLWQHRLACGHILPALTDEEQAAKRRQCAECSHAIRLLARGPLIEFVLPGENDATHGWPNNDAA
jgi:hypothetical protein